MTADPAAFDYDSETPPEGALFVAADEPLLVFPSVTAAEQYLEASDVEDGVYPAAYGPKGELYDVRCVGNSVIIERAGEQNKAEELKALLLRYLKGSGRASDATASLESLVAEVWTIESEFGGSMTRTASASAHGFRFGAAPPSASVFLQRSTL